MVQSVHLCYETKSTAAKPEDAALTAMPLSLKLTITGALTALVGGAVYLLIVRGPAMLLDMAAGAAAFICL